MPLTSLKDTFKIRGELHHACLIHGEGKVIKKELWKFFENDLKIQTSRNPDVHYFEYDSFGIADGRYIQGLAAQKALGERKIFVTAFNTMTREAQNSLLKLFEDPSERTHFFLITPNAEKLIPTLKSRLFVTGQNTNQLDDNYVKQAKVFLKKTKTDRIMGLKDLLERKDKREITNFLNALESILHTKIGERTEKNEQIIFALEELSKSKQYVFDKGASMKLLLEHVALSLPKVS